MRCNELPHPLLSGRACRRARPATHVLLWRRLGVMRHPRPHLFIEMVQGVAGFLKASVDAAGAGVSLSHGCAGGDVEGDVGDGRLDGLAVEEIATVPGHDLADASQPGGDVAGGALLADDDAVDLGPAAGLLGLGDERGLALLAVAPGEAV